MINTKMNFVQQQIISSKLSLIIKYLDQVQKHYSFADLITNKVKQNKQLSICLFFLVTRILENFMYLFLSYAKQIKKLIGFLVYIQINLCKIKLWISLSIIELYFMNLFQLIYVQCSFQISFVQILWQIIDFQINLIISSFHLYLYFYFQNKLEKTKVD
ncbi:transmembrane protein, putative (macronuclear) [Tetrahymena thermophila SB210]|uniref:Transmembrane protein, putative n=1 Tax=Tetrahymena thermophila (strain SB210) TaxID=312017 RepID=W7XDJ1_TETTS|nr:transmembrane protein, putative [Tetrahymena thermophila SB210]EWS75637.1 transmembrane protein, putative [Tetrahymena thermophila SB210]|eukprot:XP_012651783.1 transmembrane protein, putative [Tetrahymena thermophila SB210]